MFQPKHTRRAAGLTLSAAAAMLMGSLALVAQQPPAAQPPPPGQPPAAPPAGRGQQPGGRGGAPPPRAPLPVAASSVGANPDTYIGEYVSLTGVVEQNLSKTAFSVDQDKTRNTGKEVLILAPTLLSSADPNTYVTILGEVMKFDPAEVAKKAKDYKIDLPDDVIAKYRGRPVIVATAVINSALVDIAKKPLPPMTADDLALQKLMRQIGPASAAVRNADAATADATRQNVTVLKQMFAETEAFWKAKGKADATGWAADARKHVAAMEAAVAAGKWDEVKTAAAPLTQTCQACHGTYRERLDDGSYRIRMPTTGG